MTRVYPHIEKLPGEPARLARLSRIRVVQIVMDHLAHGWSVDEMCRQQPHITHAEAHAAMLYFEDHREEIEREIEQEWAAAKEGAASSQLPPRLALRLGKSA